LSSCCKRSSRCIKISVKDGCWKESSLPTTEVKKEAPMGAVKKKQPYGRSLVEEVKEEEPYDWVSKKELERMGTKLQDGYETHESL